MRKNKQDTSTFKQEEPKQETVNLLGMSVAQEGAPNQVITSDLDMHPNDVIVNPDIGAYMTFGVPYNLPPSPPESSYLNYE